MGDHLGSPGVVDFINRTRFKRPHVSRVLAHTNLMRVGCGLSNIGLDQIGPQQVPLGRDARRVGTQETRQSSCLNIKIDYLSETCIFATEFESRRRE